MNANKCLTGMADRAIKQDKCQEKRMNLVVCRNKRTALVQCTAFFAVITGDCNALQYAVIIYIDTDIYYRSTEISAIPCSLLFTGFQLILTYLWIENHAFMSDKWSNM